jgi:hypothetical protein
VNAGEIAQRAADGVTIAERVRHARVAAVEGAIKNYVTEDKV